MTRETNTGESQLICCSNHCIVKRRFWDKVRQKKSKKDNLQDYVIITTQETIGKDKIYLQQKKEAQTTNFKYQRSRRIL